MNETNIDSSRVKWRRMLFKNKKVWVKCDSKGQPVIEKNRAKIKYNLEHSREYMVNPGNLSPIPDENFNKDSASRSSTQKKCQDREILKPETREPATSTIPFPENHTDAIIIYTDGASAGNPGPSGIGVVMDYRGKRKFISRYIGNATNNIAELKAVKTALENIKKKDIPVRLFTDSSYVQGLLEYKWKANKNTELVEEIRKLMAGFKDILIIKCKGHSGIKDNELADKLATRAIETKTDSISTNY